MELVLLGTGCPQCDPDRRGPSNLLVARGRHYLVDCGSGVTQRLVEAGTKGAAIDALFLTHLHTDHLVDFYQLVISSWHQGRARPQRVFGPPGTRAFVEGTMALWAAERAQRIAHEKRASTAAFEIEVHEIGPGEVLAEDGVRVSAVAVAHQPVKHAFGYVFEADGHKAVFSGDTAYCPALIEAARGADALVHECFVHGEMPPVPGVRSAETVAAVAAYHTPSDRLGRIAREAQTKLLILNHFVPTRFDRRRLLDEVCAGFEGPVVVGEDLMRYDCAKRRLVHRDGALALGSRA
ncbi:MAG: MBL fold metallo-hydrolase [Alphaproteobacteria bacterium]|nr:MBL fold metallo-hydrolase [Alphaproteobacteria bacterium]